MAALWRSDAGIREMSRHARIGTMLAAIFVE
jgi:hypothetical protein